VNSGFEDVRDHTATCGGITMRRVISLLLVCLALSCASMQMTPEQKKRQERIEIYKLYLNYDIKHKSLTQEEIEYLDQLKKKYGAFDKVIWQ
jgi:hypothetical protein